MTQSEKIMLTPEGLKKITAELKDIKDVRRKKIAKRLADAIALGDLSENAEYSEAKEEQVFIENRALELEAIIKNVQIIKVQKSTNHKINIGSTVTIRKKDHTDTETLTIVGAMEVDSLNGKISNESPLGLALMNQKNGDKISFTTPSGQVSYDIISIK